MADRDLSFTIIEYVEQSARYRVTLDEAAEELEQFGRTNSANWPRATRQQWMRAIKLAIAQGSIRQIDGILLPKHETQLVQGCLF